MGLGFRIKEKKSNNIIYCLTIIMVRDAIRRLNKER